MPEFGTTPTLEECKAMQKKNAIQISNLNAGIRRKREELKGISESISKTIEKKIIFSNQSQIQQTRPKFNPQFADPKLKELHGEREHLHLRMSQVKSEISSLLSGEEPEVVKEYLLGYEGRILKKQSVMRKLKGDEEKVAEEKELLEGKLAHNKQVLEQFRNSLCLKQMEEMKEELERIRRQMKMVEKESNQLLSHEVLLNLYILELKKSVEKVERDPHPDELPVQKQTIDELMKEIKDLLQERNSCEKKHAREVEGLEKHMAFVARNNRQLERELRQLTSEQMQRTLDRKKKSYRSTSNVQQVEKKRQSERKAGIQPWNNLEEDAEKEELVEIEKSFSHVRPLSSNKNILIGKWNQENCIKDDIVEGGSMVRAVGIKIRSKGKKIVGIGATYINNIGMEVIGRGNIWKTEKDKMDEDEEEYQIDLEDVEWLRYSKPSADGIGLKWELKNGGSVSVGNVSSEDLDSIFLSDHWIIKSAEFCLDDNFTSISGIRLKLSEYRGNNPEEGASRHQARKWKSNSEVGLTKKKVFVKGNSHSKRLSEVAQVDHRLLLNRKKKAL